MDKELDWMGKRFFGILSNIWNLEQSSYIWFKINILRLLYLISISTSLLPVLYFLVFIRMKLENRVLVFLFYTVYSFLTDSGIRYLDSIKVLSDLGYYLLLGFFTLIEFVTFAVFFYYTIQNKPIKRAVIVSVIIFIPLTVINFLLQKDSFDHIDTVPLVFQGIFFMTLSIYYLFEQIKNPKTIFIYTTFEFWAATGILIYLSGTFFVYLLSSNLTPKQFSNFWFINYVFNIQKNIFILLGFTFLKKQKNNPHGLKDDLNFVFENTIN